MPRPQLRSCLLTLPNKAANVHLMCSTGCIFHNIYQCGCCHEISWRMQAFYAIKTHTRGHDKGDKWHFAPRQSFSDLTTTDAVTTVIFVSGRPSSERMRDEAVRLDGSGVRLFLLNTRSYKKLKMCKTVNLCLLLCVGLCLVRHFKQRTQY